MTNVRSCYPEGKRICECLCNAYASEYKIPVKIARLAQTFGAGILESDNRVYVQFAKSAIEKKILYYIQKELQKEIIAIQEIR